MMLMLAGQLSRLVAGAADAALAVDVAAVVGRLCEAVERDVRREALRDALIARDLTAERHARHVDAHRADRSRVEALLEQVVPVRHVRRSYSHIVIQDRASRAALARRAATLEERLASGARRVVRHPFGTCRPLLLRQVRGRGRWDLAAPAPVLRRVASFLVDDPRTLASLVATCHLFRFALSASTTPELDRQIAERRARRPAYRQRDAGAPPAVQRVAIRMYASSSSSSPLPHAEALQSSLAQLRGEAERVTVEHEAAVAAVRDAAARRDAAQANVTDLRRQLGQLRLAHGDLADRVRQQSDRKRALVDEVAALEANLEALHGRPTVAPRRAPSEAELEALRERRRALAKLVREQRKQDRHDKRQPDALQAYSLQ
ncbi:Rad50/SbcC-type AAA domain-containing protein [Plasmodiophora brassicae]